MGKIITRPCCVAALETGNRGGLLHLPGVNDYLKRFYLPYARYFPTEAVTISTLLDFLFFHSIVSWLATTWRVYFIHKRDRTRELLITNRCVFEKMEKECEIILIIIFSF